jgi:hypothetical protein
MNRITSMLAVLVLAATAFSAAAAEPVKEKPVVVDAMDLRAPVPDPEKGLTEKYDGKVVVFSGNLHSAGQDASTKQRWYRLTVQAIQEQSSPTAKPKMQAVIVKVHFAGSERNLPTRPSYYTVEGVGEIAVDGSLTIHNARTVSVSPKKPASSR